MLRLKGAHSRSVHSTDTGRELARELLPIRPSVALVFASVEHDQGALLRGFRETLGPDVALVGCSTQGVVGPGLVFEGGYFAAALGLGGDVEASCARVERVQVDTRRQGRALADSLLARVPDPKLALIFFDPVAGLDVSELLAGFSEVVRCPVSGAAASQPWSAMATTFQYFGAGGGAADELFTHGAVAVALSGPFEVEVAASHGTVSLGLEYQLTRVEGTQVLELDGRRATDVWEELLNVSPTDTSLIATMAVGVPNRDERTQALGEFRVLAPTVVDEATGGIRVLTSVSQGTVATMHYRSADTVLEGTRRMGQDLMARLKKRRVLGVLGFECGARTEPFLGRERTLEENIALQDAIAPNAEWVGMLAWGEVLPLTAGPAVANYTFPVVCLVDR